MRVRYSRQAFAERERIFQYLRERSTSGARNVMASIRATVAQLREHPHTGYRIADLDLRVKFVAEHPYKIFYRIRDDIAEIVHIRHTSRRPWDKAR